tara:strand:- start:395 stop:676 length:282 start_codon:yes stop_codon:yes gene_type:complete
MNKDLGLLGLVHEGFKLFYEHRREIPKDLLDTLKFVYGPAQPLFQLRELTQNEGFQEAPKWERQTIYMASMAAQSGQIALYYVASDIITMILM